MSKILGIGIGIIAVGVAAALLIFKKKDTDISATIAAIEAKTASILPFVGSSATARSDLSNLSAEAEVLRSIQVTLNNPLARSSQIGSSSVVSVSPVSSGAAATLSHMSGNYVQTTQGTHTIYRRL